MSNYVKSTNFTAKDSLPTGDANKVIRGSEFDTEFDAIVTAIATKSDLSAPTFTGEATFADLTATGTVNFSSATVSNLGAVTTADINGGTIDGVTIGGSSAGAGTFSSLVATTADINGGTVDNAVVGGSTPAAGTFTSLVATTADINGGTIDNATIGGTTPGAGTFSSLVATTADINGGSIDGAVIGGSTPAAVSGTTGTFSGAVSGTTGTFSGAVTGSNLNIANWDTAYGWGDHSTQGYLTSVAFTDIDANAVTLSSETFSDVDNQIPTNAAVIDYVAATIPLISEVNDLTAAVTWATVPDAYISASSVNQHVSVEKATQTKTYTTNETSTITLSDAITSGVPVVSVTKEVPQTGLTENTWDVASDGANYDLEDSAYSTTLTPSDASADGTFTLGSGSFAADDVGKIVSGNGGTAVILNTSGDYNLLTSFTNTSTIASGSWTLKEIVVDGDATGFALSAGAEETGGFVNTIKVGYYTGKSVSVSGQEATPYVVDFNNDGTKLYVYGSSNHLSQYDLTTAYDLSTASYASKSFNPTAQESTVQGFVLKPDGTKLYFTGSSGSVYQYSLSTAYDISTASYDSVSFSVSSQNSSPLDVQFNTDGTKMFILGGTSPDSVFMYNLSTAYDISTASYSSQNLNVSSQDTSTESIKFTADGHTMYLFGRGGTTVYEYSLKDAYDLRTARYTNRNFAANSQDSNPYGIALKNDGTRLYIVGYQNDKVYEYNINAKDNLSAQSFVNSFSTTSEMTSGGGYAIVFSTDGTKMYIAGYNSPYKIVQYDLSTAFDTTTAVYSNKSKTITEEVPAGIKFNTDGTKMFVVGYNVDDSVHQYTLSTAFDISTASYDSVSFSVNAQSATPVGLEFNNDGTKMYITQYGGSTFQYALTTGYDISTASYESKSFSYSSQDTTPVDIVFNSDGTKLFMVGDGSNAFYQYSLSTAYDISTASYDDLLLILTSQNASPNGIAINNDGTKLFMFGSASTVGVYEYSVSNLKTARYAGNNLDVSSQDTDPFGFAFNNDGTKMYMAGGTNDSIYQYTLSTAFDITTASYDNVSLNVNSQDPNPRDLTFNNDGTKMYVVGLTYDRVYQYSLTTGFDLSTASYDSVFDDISGQETIPNSVKFNNDGTKMYVTGANGDAVNQYNLSPAFDLSSATYSNTSFNFSTQDSYPAGFAFNKSGTKMYMLGDSTSKIYQYKLTTPFDVGTASYDNVNFGVYGLIRNGLEFNNDGTKMYIADSYYNEIYEFNVGSSLTSTPVVYSSDYAIAVTNSGGQIDSTFWADVNSTTATESVGTGEVYYAYSVDNHVTWKVIHNTNGERSIARNNSGTWEYNSNATYASTTWASASTNSEVGALKQALSVAANRMTGTQFDAVTDANHLTLANSLDFMIALKNADATSTSPTSDGVSINYDANTLNQGAVLGTDYNWDFPATNKVRITSLGNYNLKVRII